MKEHNPCKIKTVESIPLSLLLLFSLNCGKKIRFVTIKMYQMPNRFISIDV